MAARTETNESIPQGKMRRRATTTEHVPRSNIVNAQFVGQVGLKFDKLKKKMKMLGQQLDK